MCAILGIIGEPNTGLAVHDGCLSMQHRGQESHGFAVSDGQKINRLVAEGTIDGKYTEESFKDLKGHIGVGQNRYKTAGMPGTLKNAQPFLMKTRYGEIALCHNGNLTNADSLWAHMLDRGSIFQTDVDSEIIIHLFANSKKPTPEEALIEAVSKVRGAFCIILMMKDRLMAIRDPFGFRPLVIGRMKNKAIVFASETCAIDKLDGDYVRDVNPGELVVVKNTSHLESVQALQPILPSQHCILEHVYFAKPPSLVFGESVARARTEVGRVLARESPVDDADVIVPVPDSGMYAATGFAEESGIPLEFGLLREHSVGRTFLHPNPLLRRSRIRAKLSPVRYILNGKVVVLVDDSIVRGNTSAEIVSMVKKAGAKEVHFRVACAPVISPCYMGIDMATQAELIASAASLEEIKNYLGATSVRYVSLEGMLSVYAEAQRPSYCTSCFTGVYPVELKVKVR